jgi:hypothetical protein
MLLGAEGRVLTCVLPCSWVCAVQRIWLQHARQLPGILHVCVTVVTTRRTSSFLQQFGVFSNAFDLSFSFCACRRRVALFLLHGASSGSYHGSWFP